MLEEYEASGVNIHLEIYDPYMAEAIWSMNDEQEEEGIVLYI